METQGTTQRDKDKYRKTRKRIKWQGIPCINDKYHKNRKKSMETEETAPRDQEHHRKTRNSTNIQETP